MTGGITSVITVITGISGELTAEIVGGITSVVASTTPETTIVRLAETVATITDVFAVTVGTVIVAAPTDNTGGITSVITEQTGDVKFVGFTTVGEITVAELDNTSAVNDNPPNAINGGNTVVFEIIESTLNTIPVTKTPETLVVTVITSAVSVLAPKVIDGAKTASIASEISALNIVWVVTVGATTALETDITGADSSNAGSNSGEIIELATVITGATISAAPLTVTVGDIMLAVTNTLSTSTVTADNVISGETALTADIISGLAIVATPNVKFGTKTLVVLTTFSAVKSIPSKRTKPSNDSRYSLLPSSNNRYRATFSTHLLDE